MQIAQGRLQKAESTGTPWRRMLARARSKWLAFNAEHQLKQAWVGDREPNIGVAQRSEPSPSCARGTRGSQQRHGLLESLPQSLEAMRGQCQTQRVLVSEMPVRSRRRNAYRARQLAQAEAGVALKLQTTNRLIQQSRFQIAVVVGLAADARRVF
jgi:hypothetical protein